MARERLYLFDTTLRDGAQTNGVDFTLNDKLAIAGMLDDLGIDYVEGGYPGANPTDTELFAAGAQARHHLHRLRHDAPARPLDLERSGARGAARRQGRRHLLCRKVVGLPRAGRARDHATRRTSPRSATACAPPRRRAARCCSTASTSSTATRPIRSTRSPAPRPPMTRARAGSCCATPTAARCRTRWRRSSARCARRSRATTSASMPTTTPSRRWPIRSPRCAPARARSRARSTGSASAAATPISCPSSRP